MDKFYTSSLWGLAILGINLGNYQGFKKHIINFMLFINLLTHVIYLSQLAGQIRWLPPFVDIFGSTPKFFVMIFYKDRIKSIMDSLHDIFNQMDEEEKVQITKLSYSRRKIVSILSVVHMNVMFVVLLGIVIAVIEPYFTTGDFNRMAVEDVNWWPMDPEKNVFFGYLVLGIMGTLSAMRILLPDVIYLLILSVIIAEYRCLGEKFKKLINESAETKTFDKKSFNELVKIHQTLNDHCGSLNDIYGFSLLSYVLIIAVINCLTGYLMITNSDPDYIATNLSLLCTTLFHTFFLCWFGEKILEEVILKAPEC